MLMYQSHRLPPPKKEKTPGIVCCSTYNKYCNFNKNCDVFRACLLGEFNLGATLDFIELSLW